MCCREYFESYDGLERQYVVAESCANWACENERCSSHSPGPVRDDENVAFLVINPTHYDDHTGTLSPIAFQEVHKRDLSLVRTDIATCAEISATRDELIERAKSRIPPQLRVVEHCCEVGAKRVRDVRDEDDYRMFGIYDTALPDKPSHCSVFTRADILDSKKLRAIARSKLHAVFAPSLRPIGKILTPTNTIIVDEDTNSSRETSQPLES